MSVHLRESLTRTTLGLTGNWDEAVRKRLKPQGVRVPFTSRSTKTTFPATASTARLQEWKLQHVGLS